MSWSSNLPPALLVPLTQPGALEAIVRTLTKREQQRMQLARKHHLRQFSHRHPLGATIATSAPIDGEDAASTSLSMNVGFADHNWDKNRYKDVVAYDATRILLPRRPCASSCSSPEESTSSERELNYVNATLLQNPDLGLRRDDDTRRWWIAAQAPTTNTVHAFLSMLLTPPTSPTLESAGARPLPLVNVIVQLTPLIEQQRQKCIPYFPASVGETWAVQDAEQGQDAIWVRLQSKTEDPDGSRASELIVGRPGDQAGRKVVHIEYRGWRDHGVPRNPSHLVRFVRSTLDLNDAFPGERAPLLVHCSAGVGRTGTYITIASLLPSLSTSFEKSRLESGTDPIVHHALGDAYPVAPVAGIGHDVVGHTIDHLRDQRCTMCQTAGQIGFCYEALALEWQRIHETE